MEGSLTGMSLRINKMYGIHFVRFGDMQFLRVPCCIQELISTRCLGGIGKIKFPLLSDFKKDASEAYDVLADDGSSHRGLFLIDKHFREHLVRIIIFL